MVVKTDYGQLLSRDGGLLNHTRLLQAMVALPPSPPAGSHVTCTRLLLYFHSFLFFRRWCLQVAGALQPGVTSRYLGSWSPYPYRTATALLLDGGFDLSLHHLRSKLHLLLGRIDEMLSVTVEGQQTC